MRKKSDVLPVLAEYFDVYLPITKGVSDNTVRSYQYTFKLLFEFLYSDKTLLPEKVLFTNFEGDFIERFLIWLETDRGCSISTRNQRLACILSFSKYAVKREFASAVTFNSVVSAIPRKKIPKKILAYFTLEEIYILLRLPKEKRKSGKRDKVLLSVLYASGARAQELCDLTVKDIRFGIKTSLKLVGKGNKARTITIPDNCAKLLNAHIKSKKLDATSNYNCHIFSSQTHEHMTISCIEAIVKKYVAIAKIENPGLFREDSYSPHSFRHSIAVHMLEANIPIAVIKNFLGHASIETTMIYATVSEDLANKYLKNRNFLNGIVTDSYEDEINEAKSSITGSLSFLNGIGRKNS